MSECTLKSLKKNHSTARKILSLFKFSERFRIQFILFCHLLSFKRKSKRKYALLSTIPVYMNQDLILLQGLTHLTGDFSSTDSSRSFRENSLTNMTRCIKFANKKKKQKQKTEFF